MLTDGATRIFDIISIYFETLFVKIDLEFIASNYFHILFVKISSILFSCGCVLLRHRILISLTVHVTFIGQL